MPGSEQHYHFAFSALPLWAFRDVGKIYALLSGPACNDFLKELWRKLGEQTGEALPDQDLACLHCSIDQDEDLYLVTLPAPSEVPEAYFIAMLFKTRSLLSRVEVQGMRYFTLEKSLDLVTDGEIYVVGEVVLGKDPNHPDHLNYGAIQRNDAKAFLAAIQDLSSGQKSPGLWAYHP